MRLTLSTKMTVAFTVVALSTSATSLYTANRMQAAFRQYKTVATRLQPADATISHVLADIYHQSASMHQMIGTRNYTAKDDFEALRTTVDEALTTLDGLVVTDEDHAAVAELRQITVDYGNVADAAFTMAAGGKEAEAMAMLVQQANPLMEQAAALAGELNTKVEAATAQAQGEAEAAASEVQRITYTTLLLAFVGALTLGLFLARRVVYGVRRVVATAQAVADGDLTVEVPRIKTNDEVGDMALAFNTMVGHLRELVTSVAETAEHTRLAAENLSGTAGEATKGAHNAASVVTQVASGASNQARAAEEMRTTVEQLGTTIQQISEGSQRTAADVQHAVELLSEVNETLEQVAAYAKGVSKATGDVAESSRSGASVIEETVAGMGRIRDSVSQSTTTMQELAQLSSKIGDITGVIADIADQTNLLALNAAIEAARAGEHGRGFTVVADEVRKLAERSARSVQEINALVSDIQAKTQNAVEAMEAGSRETAKGSELAENAGKSLSELLSVVDHAVADLSEIAGFVEDVRTKSVELVTTFDNVAAVTEENSASTEEMAAGAEQVINLVTQVAAIAQENAAAAQEVSTHVEEVSGAAEKVASYAQELTGKAAETREELSRFKY